MIINLIANTATEGGLTIQVELDRGSYPMRIKVSDDELAAANITPDESQGEWSYCIRSARRKM